MQRPGEGHLGRGIQSGSQGLASRKWLGPVRWPDQTPRRSETDLCRIEAFRVTENGTCIALVLNSKTCLIMPLSSVGDGVSLGVKAASRRPVIRNTMEKRCSTPGIRKVLKSLWPPLLIARPRANNIAARRRTFRIILFLKRETYLVQSA